MRGTRRKREPRNNRIRLGLTDRQIERMERAAFLGGIEDGMFLDLPSFIRVSAYMKADAIIHKHNRHKRAEREKEEAEKTASAMG